MLEGVRYRWNMTKFFLGICSLNEAYHNTKNEKVALENAHTAHNLIKKSAMGCLKLVTGGYETEEWEPKELKRSIDVSSLYVKKMEGTIDEQDFNVGLNQNAGILSRFMFDYYAKN